jgi:hypothetical protein
MRAVWAEEQVEEPYEHVRFLPTWALCRDVDALCTKQAEDIVGPVGDVRYGICEAGEIMSYAGNANKECMGLVKRCRKAS